MSTALYDEALVNKINKWVNESQINVYGPDETSRMFEVIADKTNDERIQLPIIAINRDRGFRIINDGTTRRPLSYDGVTTYHDDVNSVSTVLNAIPISINYQIDVYTRYAKEADILVRNLIFNFVNYPGLEVEVPKATYDEEVSNTWEQKQFIHTARISLGDTIEDNSNIQERFVAGNFTRVSLNISIDDAYLWDSRKLHDVDIALVVYDIHE